MSRLTSWLGQRMLAFTFFIAALLAGAAHAQPNEAADQAPVGLQWQYMHDLVFDATLFKTTGSENEKTLMSVIWAKELAGAEIDKSNGKRFPSFVLVGSAKHNDDTYVFSMFNRALYDKCEPPPNGRSATQMYSICPLRINKINRAGNSVSKEFPGYCMLFGDDPNNRRVRNHNEYAFDPHTGIAYFRVIQYGKLVPECNRSFRLVKG
jgi:hypothetical protein